MKERMKMIQKIEKVESKKKLTVRVKMQQDIESGTNDKEFSNDDKSMSSVTNIPNVTGDNNKDTESMSIDKNEESESNGDGKKIDEDKSISLTDEEVLK